MTTEKGLAAANICESQARDGTNGWKGKWQYWGPFCVFVFGECEIVSLPSLL